MMLSMLATREDPREGWLEMACAALKMRMRLMGIKYQVFREEGESSTGVARNAFRNIQHHELGDEK